MIYVCCAVQACRGHGLRYTCVLLFRRVEDMVYDIRVFCCSGV